MTSDNTKKTHNQVPEEDTFSGHQTFEGTNLVSDLPDQDGSTSLQPNVQKVRPQDLGGTVPLASYVPDSFDAKKVGPQLIELGFVTEEEWDKAFASVPDKSVLDVFQLLMRTPGRWGELDGKPMPVLTKYQVQHILSGTPESLRLQHYLILDRIDAGAMGEVFRGWNTALSRLEAIKTFRLEKNWSATQATQGVALERFEQEARILAALVHPSITTVYHAGRDHGISFIAMEHVSGQNLKTIIDLARKSGEVVPVWWSVERVIAIAEALHHAHKKGIIHRDVKPKNIMITKDNELKILDLGIARLAASSQNQSTNRSKELTAHHVGMGTPEVMPPEQWADATAVTPASDIYSLGCTFYFMLTGRMPFKRDDMNTIMFAHISETPKLPSEFRPDIAEGLDDVIMKMLAKDPDERYQSCEELIQVLTPFVDPNLVSKKALDSKKSHYGIMAAILIGSLAVSGSITAYILKHRKQEVTPVVVKDPPVVDPNRGTTEPTKNGAGANKPHVEPSNGNSAAPPVVPVDPVLPERIKVLDQISNDINAEIDSVWIQGKGFISKDLNNLIDVSKAEKFSPKNPQEIEKLRTKIGKEAWSWLADAYLKKEAGFAWKSEDDLRNFVAKNAKDVTDAQSFRELMEVVRVATRKLIPDTAKAWLREFQSKNAALWPDLNQLLVEAEKARSFATIEDETGFEDLKKRVQDLSNAMQDPFRNAKQLVRTGDAKEDYVNSTHLANLKRIIELQAAQQPVPIEIKLLPSDKNAKLEVNATVDVVVQAPISGYLCVLIPSDSGEIQYVMQTTKAFDWSKGLVVFSSPLKKGNTEILAFIVDENWSAMGSVPIPSEFEKLPKSNQAVEQLYYTELTNQNRKNVAAAFENKLHAERVMNHIFSGVAYPLKVNNSAPKKWARGTLKEKH